MSNKNDQKFGKYVKITKIVRNYFGRKFSSLSVRNNQLLDNQNKLFKSVRK